MSITPHKNHKRLYAFDSLRASMMLLGVVFHVALYYMDTPIFWPKDPINTTIVADMMVVFSHSFRMPVFFIISGFFSCMLFLREGAVGFLKSRLKRIGIPLTVGLIVFTPLTAIGFIFANYTTGVIFKDIVPSFSFAEFLIPSDWLHLWFLYYLLYFYLVMFFLTWLYRSLNASIKKILEKYFKSFISYAFLRVSVLSMLSMLTLLPMGGEIYTVSGFVFDVQLIKIALFYFVFFSFGWTLFSCHDLLPNFTKFFGVQVILGFIVGSAILPIIHIAFLETSTKPIAVLLKSLATGLTAWLMFFGLVGTFLYYFNKPSAKVKYIADASYWVYLFHLPFAYLFPGLLKEVDLSVWIKIPVSILATIIVCFFSYHFFVRGSFIGRILNGRY